MQQSVVKFIALS